MEEIRLRNQLRLVVYPTIYRGFIHVRWCRISSINSRILAFTATYWLISNMNSWCRFSGPNFQRLPMTLSDENPAESLSIWAFRSVFGNSWMIQIPVQAGRAKDVSLKSTLNAIPLVLQKFNCQICGFTIYKHQQRNDDLANNKDSFTKVCFNIGKNMHSQNDLFAWSELRPIGQVHGGPACFWRTSFASACSSPVCKWPRIERDAVWQHHACMCLLDKMCKHHESTLIDGVESVSGQHGFHSRKISELFPVHGPQFLPTLLVSMKKMVWCQSPIRSRWLILPFLLFGKRYLDGWMVFYFLASGILSSSSCRSIKFHEVSYVLCVS